MRSSHCRVSSLAALLLGACLLIVPRPAAAGPDRPRHPIRAPRAPRPTRVPRIPRFNPTPPAAQNTPTPTLEPSTPTPQQPATDQAACPAQPTFRFQTKVSKLFYAYPGTDRNLHASGFFSLNPQSNGFDPLHEHSSLSLTDDDGVVILSMPDVQFIDDGSSGFSASNEQGFVTITPFAGTYAFSFAFDDPHFAPGFFRVRYHLCLNVGDDGISEAIVCQPKPRDGFLCHP